MTSERRFFSDSESHVSSVYPQIQLLTLATAPPATNTMDPCVPSEKKSDSDVNGTVVVNMLTLEVAVEDVDTAGEKAGKTTAHETLLIHAGWKRHHCFGAAVQKGQFRVVSGFRNGLREGYKIVTAPAYDGPHSAFGQLQTDRFSKALDAFKKFTKDKENREKADIPEKARKLAVELAGVEGFSKASFYLDPLAQARTLDYLCSFGGGMEDCCASKEMLEHSLKIYEKHLGGDHWGVAATLVNLGKRLLTAWATRGSRRTSSNELSR